MGVDPEHGWEAHYPGAAGKEKVVEELQNSPKTPTKSISPADPDPAKGSHRLAPKRNHRQ